jgi:Leucine-rich repeat (LRR) protein
MEFKNNYIKFFLLILVILIYTSCKSQDVITKSTSIDKALKHKNTITSLVIMNNSNYNEFPIEIFKLKKLKILSFTGSECHTKSKDCNNIENIPKGIKKLVNLEKLKLVMNNIKLITNEINTLQNLKELDLSNNINLSIDNLHNKNIVILNLNGCNLNKLPININKMLNLKVLGLEGNNINYKEIELLKQKLPNCEIYW